MIGTLKALLLFHNYTKKGPKETVLIDDKEVGPLSILTRIKNYYDQPPQNSKDKHKTVYIVNLIKKYSVVLIEKTKLSIEFKNFIENNYSLTPFFNNFQT